jgi:outer membrane protein
MKNISLFLNIVLLGAVGYLYYAHFSADKKAGKTRPAARLVRDSLMNTGSSIAYLEIDSVNQKVDYIRELRKEIESEQRGIEKEWENGYRSLENQKNEFLKKGAAITEDMARDFQGKLLQQQEQIDMRKQQLTQKLTEKSIKLMDDLEKNLKEFLEEYNKEHSYTYIFTAGSGLDFLAYKDSALNITADVIEGMNERLKDNKKP